MAKASSRMVNGGHDFILQDDRFLSKLLSKEKYNSRQGEASFRVLYYGGAAGAVPFEWESQPGTPKHALAEDPLPPLTPPPSYQSSHRQANPLQKQHSKFFTSIFHRAKINASSPSFSQSSSNSSSYSLSSTPFNARKGNLKARPRSVAHFGLDDDEYEPGTRSPTSTLCFGMRNGSSSRRLEGCSHPIKSVKKIVFSIAGHAKAE